MRSRTLVVMAAIGLLAAGCSGDDGAAGGAPSGSSTPSATPSATPAPSVTPTVTPSAVPTPAGPRVRTAAELRRALLGLDDLPSGFSIEKDTGGDDGFRTSSKRASCARLVALMNADKAPGSKASAAQSYSGGQQGPFVDESLDALGTPQAVAALQTRFRAAVRACPMLTVTIAGEGSSPVEVAEVSAPKAGTNPVAARFTPTGGPLEGLEFTLVTTGVGDVVLALNVLGHPDDVDGATVTAAEKAAKVLKTPTTGT